MYEWKLRRKKHKQLSCWKDIIIVVVVLIVGIAVGFTVSMSLPAVVTSSGNLSSILALSTNGFTEVVVEATPNLIILHKDCRELTMVSMESQTFSIAAGLEGIRPFRPLTHDLFSDVFDMFGMDVMLVKIESLEEGVYYAKTFISQGNKILSLDSRPSDAIGIAVRTGAPVYINQTLLEEDGDYTC